MKYLITLTSKIFDKFRIKSAKYGGKKEKCNAQYYFHSFMNENKIVFMNV